MIEFEPYRCNMEDYNFEVPKDIFRDDGTCKYAYVSLLMMGDNYLPGLLNLAYSIKKISQIDRVIMITDDVSLKARELLEKLYTKIIIVDYIEPIKGIVKRSLIERYPHYAKTFTKLNLFKLTEYEKVLFLDGDTLVIKNFDSLFTLPPPAAVYYGASKMHENNYRPRLKGDKYIWHTKYCKCCDHGKKIPDDRTNVVKKEYEGKDIIYGVSTECMLLKPDLTLFGQMMKELNSIDFIKTNPKGFMSDAGYITWKFSGQWTGVDPRFLGRRGYPRIEEVFGITLGGAKPWVYDNIKFSKSYPDYKYWYETYEKMMDEMKFDDKKLIELKNEIEKNIDLSKHVSIKIFIPVKSFGLEIDAKIFKDSFLKNIKNCTVDIIYPETKIHMDKYSDINLFLESINDFHRQFIDKSRYKLFMVNHEFFDYNKVKDKNIDLFICKTKEGRKYMERYNVKTYYTKFTTPDFAYPSIKEYNKFFHGAGSSTLKSTDIVIKTWQKYKNLPELIVICYDRCYENLKKYVELNNLDNITLYDKKIDYEKVIKFKTEIGFHLCPSMIEGYGHYINEARIASAVALIINAPPMNELITEESGVLINYSDKITRKNGSYQYITSEDHLYNGIKKMLNLNENERIEMGTFARHKYESDTVIFNMKMEKLCKRVLEKIENN